MADLGSADLTQLLTLAAKQWGAFSRAQAIRHGFSSSQIARRLRAGEWCELVSGVYRVAGTPITWEAMAFAALCWGGPASCLSHESAARLHGIEGFDGCAHISISVPRKLRPHPKIRAHRTGTTGVVTKVRGMRVTDPKRTLLDLAGVCSPQATEAALDEALRKRLVTLIGLKRMLQSNGTRGRKGAGVLERLVDERDPRQRPTESQLETLTRRIIKDARLPLPDQQRPIRDGSHLRRVDFIYDTAGVIIEVDSFTHHSDKNDWWSDMERRNGLTKQKWRVYHVTYWGLKANRRALVDWLREVLER